MCDVLFDERVIEGAKRKAGVKYRMKMSLVMVTTAEISVG